VDRSFLLRARLLSYSTGSTQGPRACKSGQRCAYSPHTKKKIKADWPKTTEHSRQMCGCPASRQDHMRKEVEVRSMAGSVVVYDCMLSL